MSDIPDLSHDDVVALVRIARLCPLDDEDPSSWLESGASKPDFRVPEDIAYCDKRDLVRATCAHISDSCGSWIDEHVFASMLRNLATDAVKDVLTRAGLADVLRTCREPISMDSTVQQTAQAIGLVYEYLHPSSFMSPLLARIDERVLHVHCESCQWPFATIDDTRSLERAVHQCELDCRKRVRQDDDAQELAAKK